MSMKEALDLLGLGPCHHMTEVMENPAQLDFWKTIAAGEVVDWEDVFEGYQSQVDWPGAHVWQETSIAFPDARAAVARLLELSPTLTVSRLRALWPIRNPQTLSTILDGLRQAGLPE